MRIEKSIEVGVPVHDAYRQWMQLEDFPRFMSGVKGVRQIDNSHLHWIAEVGGETREWDAEIVEQEPDRLIAWRSTSGTRNAGRVRFEPVDRGTRLTVEIEHEPAGVKERIGSLIGAAEVQVEEDLLRFREFIERGARPTGERRGRIEHGEVVDDDQRPVGHGDHLVT